MRKLCRRLGWTSCILAVALLLLGVLTWPPGGLMFAMPYVFLIPGAILAVFGGLLVLLGRQRGAGGPSSSYMKSDEQAAMDRV